MINYLSAEQIKANVDRLYKITRIAFPKRAEALIAMYEDLGERVYLAPASSANQAHNGFPGGYTDHVLRVIGNVKNLYKFYKYSKMPLDGFTTEEILFGAMFHDLGKLGFQGEGNEYYLPNPNAWEIEKKGKDYTNNTNIPWMSIPDAGIFNLQHYGIKMTFNEMHTIRVHDGLFDDLNKTYFLNWFGNGKFKTVMPDIVMQADYMAMRFEYFRFINGELTPAKKQIKQ